MASTLKQSMTANPFCDTVQTPMLSATKMPRNEIIKNELKAFMKRKLKILRINAFSYAETFLWFSKLFILYAIFSYTKLKNRICPELKIEGKMSTKKEGRL